MKSLLFFLAVTVTAVLAVLYGIFLYEFVGGAINYLDHHTDVPEWIQRGKIGAWVVISLAIAILAAAVRGFFMLLNRVVVFVLSFLSSLFAKDLDSKIKIYFYASLSVSMVLIVGYAFASVYIVTVLFKEFAAQHADDSAVFADPSILTVALLLFSAFGLMMPQLKIRRES